MATAPTNLCYCTNVHAGVTAKSILKTLDDVSAKVRDAFCPGEALGLGLWMPDGVGLNLSDDRFAVRTMNGFPFGDFHDKVVKHMVYEPTWADLRRSNYTWTLAAFLQQHTPEGGRASVSTVPIGWDLEEEAVSMSGEMLRGLAVSLSELAENRGRHITVDLEPEPGCVLDTSEDVTKFFAEHLDNEHAMAHIGVCHDVCHASVMFEGQREALQRYIDAGIRVNKVQVSSAPRAVFGEDVRATIEALRAFDEGRYLHQTVTRDSTGTTRFFEDLPHAFGWSGKPGEEWRTHFHVPVYLESLDEHLGTTQADILECMDACAELGIDPVWEVETYAWGVLPEAHRVDDLAEGIARELAWTRDRLAERGLLK